MALLQNVIMRGTHAARPAAGSQGLLFFETDTGQLFRDSGSAWQLIDVTSLFATKGDLLVGTGSGTVAKLAAGTDTYVLTADSAQTDGIKWAASAGGNAGITVRGRMHTATAQSLTSTLGPVLFDTIDEGSGNWDAANHRVNAPATGDYLIAFHVGINAGTSGIYLAIRVNGTADVRTAYTAGSGSSFDWSGGKALTSGDTVDFCLAADVSASRTLAADYCWFTVSRLS